MYTLNSKGRLFVLDQPIIMGILNATNDSFFEKSRVDLTEIVDKAGLMLEQGASILDIGGQSTRPGAEQIGSTFEAERAIPAVEAVKKAFPEAWISIDTYHAQVANLAVLSGADMVNDISAGDDDPNMLTLIAKLQVPYIAMHKKGQPETMQHKPEYQNVVTEVVQYFLNKKKQLDSFGVYDWIIDPGFGFGKTTEHNYLLFKNISTFEIFNRPILIGISRKGMIQKALNISAENALNGTTALHMAGLIKGANILRVHDVKEAAECITLYKNMMA